MVVDDRDDRAKKGLHFVFFLFGRDVPCSCAKLLGRVLCSRVRDVVAKGFATGGFPRCLVANALAREARYVCSHIRQVNLTTEKHRLTLSTVNAVGKKSLQDSCLVSSGLFIPSSHRKPRPRMLFQHTEYKLLSPRVYGREEGKK